MFFKKKKVTFDKVARFNYELDTNEKLKEELKKLALCRNDMTKDRVFVQECCHCSAMKALILPLKSLICCFCCEPKPTRYYWKKQAALVYIRISAFERFFKKRKAL